MATSAFGIPRFCIALPGSPWQPTLGWLKAGEAPPKPDSPSSVVGELPLCPADSPRGPLLPYRLQEGSRGTPGFLLLGTHWEGSQAGDARAEG